MGFGCISGICRGDCGFVDVRFLNPLAASPVSLLREKKIMEEKNGVGLRDIGNWVIYRVGGGAGIGGVGGSDSGCKEGKRIEQGGGVMPTASTKLSVVILWEHEIVEAVRAFDRLWQKKEPDPEDMRHALQAAYAAIYHPEILTGGPFVIMSANRHFFQNSQNVVRCPECGEPVPDHAVECDKCGCVWE